jgi:hypothetical protein
MWLVTAAVVVFGTLTTLNLILTLGVIRRLREQSERLATVDSGQSIEPMIAPGQTPADFTATTIDGEVITRDDVTGARLIAFVSPTCDACAVQIPMLLDRAASMPGGRDNVVVVVVGKGDGVVQYAEQFRAVAHVVAETATGPVTRAFEAGGFPAFGLLDADGRLVASAVSIDRLDLPVPS